MFASRRLAVAAVTVASELDTRRLQVVAVRSSSTDGSQLVTPDCSVTAGRAVTGRRSPDARRHPPATYRRRRVLAVGLVVAVGLSVWSGARVVLGAVGGQSVQLIRAHVVVVRPGETLWSIAVAQDPQGNVLPLLDRLETETHDRPLQVGEQIVVP
jgi:nucleoid-associated protein YgaU